MNEKTSSVGERPRDKDPNQLSNTGSIAAGISEVSSSNQPQKSMSMISTLGIGFSILNSNIAILQQVASTPAFGGPPVFFWGILLTSVIAMCVAITLGEFVSIWPHSGGQYFWVAQLSPKGPRRFLSYITAVVSWSSAVCIGASCALGSAYLLFSLVQLFYPELESKPWMVFLVFQGLNIFMFGFNCFESLLPVLGRGFLILTVSVMFITFTALFAGGKAPNSAYNVFIHFTNTTSWPDGVAFLIGVNGMNWAFSCLDASTHLAEEIPEPRKNIPKVLIWTVLVGLFTAIMMVLAVFFNVTDLETNNNVQLIFYSIFHDNKPVAIALQILVLISAYCSLLGIHTWQSRIAWALSRDKGLPFHNYLSRLAPAPYGTPIWAHLWSTVWISILGCLYLGSQVAFNSFIAGGLILQYLTYSLPIILLLRRGRNNVPHGPFWNPILGLIANIVTLVWTAIIIVFYSLPYYLPVVAVEMNYVSAVLAAVMIYAVGYWFAYGRNHYELPADLSLWNPEEDIVVVTPHGV